MKTNRITDRGGQTAYGFEPGAAKRMNVENRFYKETAPTLRADMGDNQTAVVLCLNDQGGAIMNVSYDVTGTLRSQTKHHEPIVLIYDARGNGEGSICPTITGDHQSRITDYTAIVVEENNDSPLQQPE